MSFEIEITESAKTALIDVFLYYEKQQTNLGKRFIETWENWLTSLKNNTNCNL